MNIMYYALGDENTASSRLRVHKIVPELLKLGHITRVGVQDMCRPLEGDIILVQKRLNMRREMQAWIDRGFKVIFDLDDPSDIIPPHTLMTVGSTALAERYPGSVYVPDCLDIDDTDKFKTEHAEELKTVCWFGLRCNLFHAMPVWLACQEIGLQLVVVTNREGFTDVPEWRGVQYLQWSKDTADDTIMQHDIVACPYVEGGRWGTEWTMAKGENRLLKAWALGMPVIGSPIPSYVEHDIKQTAWTPLGWMKQLELLKDRKLREQDAKRGRRIALRSTADRVAEKWLKVFRSVKN